jgi:hypothetical protein
MNAPAIERLAVQPRRAAQMIDKSLATIYRLINEGELDAVKCRAGTLVLVPSLHRYLENLPPFEGRTDTQSVRPPHRHRATTKTATAV